MQITVGRAGDVINIMIIDNSNKNSNAQAY